MNTSSAYVSGQVSQCHNYLVRKHFLIDTAKHTIYTYNYNKYITTLSIQSHESFQKYFEAQGLYYIICCE